MEVWGWVLAAFVMGWAVKGLMDKGGCLCEDKGAKLKCGLMSDDLSIRTAPCRASVRELDYEGNLCIGWQANESLPLLEWVVVATPSPSLCSCWCTDVGPEVGVSGCGCHMGPVTLIPANTTVPTSPSPAGKPGQEKTILAVGATLGVLGVIMMVGAGISWVWQRRQGSGALLIPSGDDDVEQGGVENVTFIAP